ncbi:hypothetical protein NDU88_001070 [Pleurodeles waltl]|uniref:Uncharacterized protein n=1 Tax=Pleurodeles waltl TaxID=8319 RepID=A0AAV7KNK8_PLEWA|nr:hypothetical protein NDU88_001070 [Pleurodeles waltl]
MYKLYLSTDSCDQILNKNDISTKGLQFKEKRQQLVDEIFSFLDNNKYMQENEALRIENRKLKNANSRLRYKTKGETIRKVNNTVA